MGGKKCLSRWKQWQQLEPLLPLNGSTEKLPDSDVSAASEVKKRNRRQRWGGRRGQVEVSAAKFQFLVCFGTKQSRNAAETGGFEFSDAT